MQAFEVGELLHQQQRSGDAWQEFLHVDALSMGLYLLAAGSEDTQQPHSEDEIYYIVQGRGQIRVGSEDRPVQAGSIVYVAKAVEHRFHTITEDLQILVFFAPAEYSQARNTAAD